MLIVDYKIDRCLQRDCPYYASGTRQRVNETMARHRAGHRTADYYATLVASEGDLPYVNRANIRVTESRAS